MHRNLIYTSVINRREITRRYHASQQKQTETFTLLPLAAFSRKSYLKYELLLNAQEQKQNRTPNIMNSFE